jgi:hypothetical protein
LIFLRKAHILEPNTTANKTKLTKFMKNKIRQILAFTVLAAVLSSCATVFGGKVSEYQKTKPAAGQPQRNVRVAALICDILLFWPGTIVDFATGAIYKPEGK